MSYAVPTSWTDVDAGGNAVSWITRAGKLFRPGYEMLRLALTERGDGCGLDLPTILSSPRGSHTIYDGWVSAFQSRMDDIIARYCNHLDNGGSWDNHSAPPFWTEATILAAAGESSREPPRLCAAWSLQQYKLLNLLRWSMSTVLPTVPITGSPTPNVKGYRHAPTWANAQTNWLATPWAWIHPFYAARHLAIFESPFGYRISRTRMTYRFSQWLSSSYSHTIHIYCPFSAPSSYTYENNDYAVDEDNWGLIHNDVTPGLVTSVDVTLGDFETVTVSDPTAGWNGWTVDSHYSNGYYYLTARAVVKHDVPGGFAFIV